MFEQTFNNREFSSPTLHRVLNQYYSVLRDAQVLKRIKDIRYTPREQVVVIIHSYF